MPLLDDMTDLLSSGTTSTSISKDYLPTSPDTCLAIYGYGGLAPTHTMVNGPGLSVLEEPRVQIVARSMSLQSAHRDARSVYRVVNGLRKRTINGMTYHWASAIQEPFLLERDANSRFAVACNYEIKKDRST
jgi:hypothetical protein